jgi:hypothetical protein
LGQAGLVSGAVFSDLEGDGFPELVLACECGLLRISPSSGSPSWSFWRPEARWLAMMSLGLSPAGLPERDG